MSPSASKSGGAAVSRNRVERRPLAIRDLADIAVFLAEESGSDETAFRFLEAGENSFAGLATMSEMGATGNYVVSFSGLSCESGGVEPRAGRRSLFWDVPGRPFSAP